MRGFISALVLTAVALGWLMTVDVTLKEGRFTRWCSPHFPARHTTADDHYRFAERYYEAGDFEKSALECEKVLRLAPAHAPARALLTEDQFILGQGKTTPYDERYEAFMHRDLVRNLQLLVEIDNAYERAKRHDRMGELAQAKRELRKILELAKWMPTGIELETRRKQALEMLQRVRDAATGP